MNVQTTQLPGLQVTLTAHEGPEGRLLLAGFSANLKIEWGPLPTRVAVVIDRSGSMSGEKLKIAKSATAKLVKSLHPTDKIAVVTYDNQVQVISPLVEGSYELAQRVQAIRSGGSTALYDGWLQGAKLVGPGGRVILLSDGLANEGRYVDADSLARHAGLSYERFRVTTSTIGIGADYDEALMAGMARRGGGGHYYAHNAEAIFDAFSQERFSMDRAILEHVSLRYGGETFQLGHLWAEESKKLVWQVRDLSSEAATVRYTRRDNGQVLTLPLQMPRSFGHSDEATLELIFKQAGDMELRAGGVYDPESARRVRAELRNLLLRLLSHPLADTEVATTVRRSLESSMARLESLERDFDAQEASIHRKRSQQASRNIGERAKAFSSFEEDRLVVASLYEVTQSASSRPLEIDPNALALLPLEQWMAWPALPVEYLQGQLRVVLPNARDGFTLSEIQKATGVPTSVEPRSLSSETIRKRLSETR